MTAARVAVVDYGMGNLKSVEQAFTAVGVDVVVAGSPSDAGTATHAVLPGVGAFGDGMRRLHERGWDTWLRSVAADGLPLLGICLGMQLLADLGTEHGDHEGLGLVPGRVDRLPVGQPRVRIPHVGWNDVEPVGGGPLFNGADAPQVFYFVHSFAFTPDSPAAVAGTCTYGTTFAAAVALGCVAGVQFHPEKSQQAGLQLLTRFASWRPC